MNNNEIRNEIFCRDCKYFKHWWFLAEFCDTMSDSLNVDDKCNHPENTAYQSHYNKKEKVYLQDPEYLNRYNNCKWFVPKMSLFRLLLSLFGKKG
jgi:hypothetical protein